MSVVELGPVSPGSLNAFRERMEEIGGYSPVEIIRLYGVALEAYRNALAMQGRDPATGPELRPGELQELRDRLHHSTLDHYVVVSQVDVEAA